MAISASSSPNVVQPKTIKKVSAKDIGSALEGVDESKDQKVGDSKEQKKKTIKIVRSDPSEIAKMNDSTEKVTEEKKKKAGKKKKELTDVQKEHLKMHPCDEMMNKTFTEWMEYANDESTLKTIQKRWKDVFFGIPTTIVTENVENEDGEEEEVKYSEFIIPSSIQLLMAQGAVMAPFVSAQDAEDLLERGYSEEDLNYLNEMKLVGRKKSKDEDGVPGGSKAPREKSLRDLQIMFSKFNHPKDWETKTKPKEDITPDDLIVRLKKYADGSGAIDVNELLKKIAEDSASNKRSKQCTGDNKKKAAKKAKVEDSD